MAKFKHSAIPALSRKVTNSFWSKVDVRGPDECWPWIGARSKKGYGKFKITVAKHQYDYRAHRIAYFVQHDKDPGVYEVCHSCDNPPCCNGRHLFTGTRSDNAKDSWRKGRGSQNGRPIHGSKQHASKFSEQDIPIIRAQHAKGVATKDLAAQYGVRPWTIWRIARRIYWRHVP